MKPHTLFILIFMGLLMSCGDELSYNQSETVIVDDSTLVETGIYLNVAAMDIKSSGSSSRTRGNESATANIDEEKQGTDAERRIDNIWVFQFDATSKKLLITPRYYELEASPDEQNAHEVNVLLKPNVESIVYVVANTGSKDWASVDNSSTFDDVKRLSIPLTDYYYYIAIGAGGELAIDDKRIPMEGESVSVVTSQNGKINVKLIRMFAKVEINIGYIPETLDIYDVVVENIPEYCQVGSIAPIDENVAADYPTETGWGQCVFNPKDDQGKYKTMTIYLPENLQGRNKDATENDAEYKTNNASGKNALYLNFKANYKNLFTGSIEDTGREYIFYPGADNYSDYNIKRNNIYKITLNLYTDRYNVATPSSNCFVVKPGQLLSFLPYYRTESGGGYDFSNYLSPDGDESIRINDSKTMTDNVRIIWQTKGAIGDNTNGDKVWIDPKGTDDKKKRKIYVRAGEDGNALIGAFNSKGEIIWSWHIWVTKNEPANLSSAVVYSTYAWNEFGIKTDIRVPGYAIMPCNIGALSYEPRPQKIDSNEVDPDTHGMLYQWGRKDPFPPAIRGDQVEYKDYYTGTHYGNDNTTPVTKTSGTTEDYLFHSLAAKNIETVTGDDVIKYTIQHPTVFLCGTKEAFQNENYTRYSVNYQFQGDWMKYHDDKLWGGKPPVIGTSMKY